MERTSLPTVPRPTLIVIRQLCGTNNLCTNNWEVCGHHTVHISNMLIIKCSVFVRGIATGVGDVIGIYEYNVNIAGAIAN